MGTILLTGFGPFLEVAANPSGRLTLALDGSRAGGHTIVGRVLPVAYRRGLRELDRLIADTRPEMIIATGVASRRSMVCVEQIAAREIGGLEDIDGEDQWVHPPGPDTLRSSLDVASLVGSLGARRSRDAGRYLCNATLYHLLLSHPDIPSVFIHVPPAGLAPARLLTALSELPGTR